MVYPKKQGNVEVNRLELCALEFFLSGNILSLEKGPRDP